MADATFQPKVYKKDGGNTQVIASGGKQKVESGGEVDIESGGSLKLAGTAVTATAAEVNALDGATPGTAVASKALVVDANRDIDTIRLLSHTSARTMTGSSAAGTVADRFGGSVTEGYELKIVDQTVSGFTGAKTFDLTADVPAGAYILSVQANIETLVVAGGTSVKVAIGVAGGDVDKYGKTGTLAKNQKIDTIPTHAILASAEDVQIGIVVTDGSTLGDTDASAGAVRIRIVYALPNSLDDAA